MIPHDQDTYEYLLEKGWGELAHKYYLGTVFVVPLKVTCMDWFNMYPSLQTFTYDYDNNIKPKLTWLDKIKRLWNLN